MEGEHGNYQIFPTVMKQLELNGFQDKKGCKWRCAKI